MALKRIIRFIHKLMILYKRLHIMYGILYDALQHLKYINVSWRAFHRMTLFFCFKGRENKKEPISSEIDTHWSCCFFFLNIRFNLFLFLLPLWTQEVHINCARNYWYKKIFLEVKKRSTSIAPTYFITNMKIYIDCAKRY